jgi:hypothetical protein
MRLTFLLKFQPGSFSLKINDPLSNVCRHCCLSLISGAQQFSGMATLSLSLSHSLKIYWN